VELRRLSTGVGAESCHQVTKNYVFPPLPLDQGARTVAPMSQIAVYLYLALTLASLADDPFQALVRPTDALTPAEEQTKLHVPSGFTIGLYASEPMINKPINIAFDAKGRMWVTSNTEYPFPAARERWSDASGASVKDSRDAIKILEDTDHDGKADKVINFVDGLNVPIGVLPYGQGCIAWSIPNIWYYADTNGDGKCDQRTILFGPLGYENDTHGNVASLRMGADGWVYATHGFANRSHFEVRPENLHGRKVGDPGTTLDLQSGNVFRFRPDGSAVEIWAHGQVNPFGLCWDAWGNLYSADCHSNPLTQLIHQAYYPSFGKPDDGLGFGPVLCPHTHGSTGLCGALYLTGNRWGEEWNDHMLLGNCVTSKINRDFINYTGATPLAQERPDFLTSEDPWFRPVDLQFGPDGALYVADFYNKIIGHYEVPRDHPGRDRHRGRIWRIEKQDAKVQPDAGTAQQLEAQTWRFGKPAPSTALSTLQNPNAAPQLRRIVSEWLISHPQPDSTLALLALTKSTPTDDPTLRHTLRLALRNALAQPGGFAGLPSAEADEALLAPLIGTLTTKKAIGWLVSHLTKHPPARTELVSILRTLARNLPENAQETLVTLVKKQFPQDLDAQGELLQSLLQGISQRGSKPQPFVMAWGTELAAALSASLATITTIDWSGDTAIFATDTRPKEGGGQLSVLSSLPPPRSQEMEVRTGTLRSRPFTCPAILSLWICGHNGKPEEPASKKNYVRLVDAKTGEEWSNAHPPREDTARRIEWRLSDHAGKLARLEITDGSSDKAYAWLAVGDLEPAVISMSISSDSQRWQHLAEITSSFKLAKFAPSLAAAFSRDDLTDPVRKTIAKTLTQFPEQAQLLADLFKTSPSRLQSLLAEMLATTVSGAEKLCELAPARLLTQPNIAQQLAALKQPSLDARIKQLTKDLPPANAEIEALLKSRLQGFQSAKIAGGVNSTAGKTVFQQQCAICHQLEGQGKQIGPQLEGAKNRGAERLCEDILDPNRAVDPNFHLHIIKLDDNSVLAGLQRREEGAALILADVAGTEHTVPKARIKDNTESALSLMPPAFGQTIPEADFYHLLAYLLEH
jgi:putative heme-binding domain-containing protein